MKQFGIGQPVRRVEDRRFITGRGRYLDDIKLPDMLHAAFPGNDKLVPRPDRQGR